MDGSFLVTDPCLLIFNHPRPYFDVALADLFIRRLSLKNSTHIVVNYPHSIAHTVFTLPMSKHTITMPVHARNKTTEKIAHTLRDGSNVAAFYADYNQGHGLFWAMLDTNVPTYTVRINKTICHVERVQYEQNMNVTQIRAIVRRQLGYEP
jgi:hypothetical protein